MSSSVARYFPGDFPKHNEADTHSIGSVEELTTHGREVEAAEEMVSDEDLILRLQKRDVVALGLLYERYARLTYWVCVRILSDQAEAEDLVHDVFLCMYRLCSSFDPRKVSARSWLVHVSYQITFIRRASCNA